MITPVEISEQSQRVLAMETWLKPLNVSTMMSEWVLKLLPHDVVRGENIWKAAALLGSQEAEKVNIGQVSYVQRGAGIVQFGFKTVRGAEAIDRFGKTCCMTAKASILRTAIMIGLELPRVELGVMSQTRGNVFERQEVLRLMHKAKRLFPEEFKT